MILVKSANYDSLTDVTLAIDEDDEDHEKRYLVIKVREVKIVKEVKLSDGW